MHVDRLALKKPFPSYLCISTAHPIILYVLQASKLNRIKKTLMAISGEQIKMPEP